MAHGNTAYVILRGFSGRSVLAAYVVLDNGDNVLCTANTETAAVHYGDSNHTIRDAVAADVAASALSGCSVTVDDFEFVTG